MLNQAIERIERCKANHQLTAGFSVSVFFKANLYRGHELIGEFFFHPAQITRFFGRCIF